MTTLRRDARTKLEGILARFSDKLTLPERETIADLQVDALLELRGFSFLATDEIQGEYKTKKRGDIMDGILAYQQDNSTLLAFERAFGFGTLPWFSTGTWEKFAKFLLKTGPGWFADYVRWREGDGKYKAFSNRKIRENPQAFIDTGYPEFEVRDFDLKKSQPKKEYIRYDPEEEKKYVPNPNPRSRPRSNGV